jgi:hypothetical protein
MTADSRQLGDVNPALADKAMADPHDNRLDRARCSAVNAVVTPHSLSGRAAAAQPSTIAAYDVLTDEQ